MQPVISFQQERTGFQKLMRLKTPPDAISAGGEQITLAAYSECKKMGYSHIQNPFQCDNNSDV